MSRKLLSTYGGALYAATGATIDAIKGQDGSNRQFDQTSTARPTLVTAGPKGRAAADFDGSNDFMTTTGVGLSTFLSNSTGYFIISALIDALTFNDPSAFNNHALFSEPGQNFGVYLRANAGSPLAYAYNWDGNEDKVQNGFTTGVPYVFEWEHSGGNVRGRVNGGTWQSTASGNTNPFPTTNAICLFASQAATNILDGKFFEMVVFSTAPSSAQQDALAANFKAWIGA